MGSECEKALVSRARARCGAAGGKKSVNVQGRGGRGMLHVHRKADKKLAVPSVRSAAGNALSRSRANNNNGFTAPAVGPVHRSPP